MSLNDLQCRKCAHCKDITLVAFPSCTPYICVECPKLPVVGYIYLYHPFSYGCHEFTPKEASE